MLPGQISAATYTTEYGKVKEPKNVTEKSKKSTHFEKAVIVVL